MTHRPEITGVEDYQFGFHEKDISVFRTERGLTRKVVEAISERKGEPDWMREFRLRSLEVFQQKPMPLWGGDLSQLDFDDITYYVRPMDEMGRTWDDVPGEIKDTFGLMPEGNPDTGPLTLHEHWPDWFDLAPAFVAA